MESKDDEGRMDMEIIYGMEKEHQRTWIEGWRAYFLERAYLVKNSFYLEFYVQCIESTNADGYEMLFDTPTAHNYFYNKRHEVDQKVLFLFYKLEGIHHTIRAIKRRKKELDWETMKVFLYEVYNLGDREIEMAEVLYRCDSGSQGQFQEIFIKVTARYLFGDRILDGFSFAFMGNFWYNSYSNFMGSFVGYVPFHVRMNHSLENSLIEI